MITKQGREVKNSDILLYNLNMRDIIVIVNDDEQLKKYVITGRYEDAPIAIIPYTDEALTNIISEMKQIKTYKKLKDNIKVEYTDGTSVSFDLTNEEIIKTNMSQQRLAKERKISSSWYDIPEKEKEKKRKTTQTKLTKSVAAILAAAAVSAGLYSYAKSEIKKENDGLLDETNDSTLSSYNNSSNSSNTNEEYMVSDFTKEAELLYLETQEKNSYILKLQQIANVKWNKDLALEVVEYMNGMYPTEMTFMNEKNAMAEATEIQQAISLLIAGNLNTETKEEDMIDLSMYVKDEKERVFIHNAMIIARSCIQESIGEPMNGRILDEDAWTDVNKFSREYINSVDQLLNYEFDTINDPEFITCSFATRFIIGTIFQHINSTIPQWSYVTRESSEQDSREYDLYYRYFFDDVRKITYLPEPGPNGTTQYRAYWADENSLCHEEGPYTEDVMFAMAGKTLEEDEVPEQLGVQVNPDIHHLGIETQVDSCVETARNELFQLTNDYCNVK